MAVVLTNNTSFAYAIESSLGVLPGSPTWKTVEPNSVGAIGGTNTTVAREPISKNRQRRKGTIVDRDATFEWEGDLTLEHVIDFIEGFMYATASAVPQLQSGAAFNSLAADNDPGTAGTESGFTHSALGAALAANTLIYTRGFTTAANNGLFVVTGDSTTTVTEVTVSTLIDETPGNQANATLSVCGRRGATGDLVWTHATKTLSSTALNFTTLFMTVGQTIHIGGLTSTNQFAGGVLYARIKSIAANAVVFDKLSGTLSANDAGTGKQIDLLYGRYIRNVSVDDALFLSRSYQFEVGWDNLQNPDATGDEYEYLIGNRGNTLTIDAPETDKITMAFGFIGTDAAAPTTSRKTGGSTPVSPVQTTAFNTTSDLVRLRILEADETGLTTCIKSWSLTLDNQGSPEKCQGTLGAISINYGLFLVNLTVEAQFTDSDVLSAIIANRTVTWDAILKNSDGAIALDIPSMTLGDGARDLTLNETVKINLEGEAFQDATLGNSLGVSLFPVVP